LFGWKAEAVPGGEEAAYAMMKSDGDEVCAVYEAHGDWGEGVAPSHWFSSVSVESADATAARAAELGGEALGEAFEVFDMGRVAVMRDPTGAVFGAGQPRSYAGARRVNDLGYLCLNQLNTRDPERAAGFYAGLFGWEIEQVADEPPFWGINNKGWLNGGMMGMPDEAGAPVALARLLHGGGRRRGGQENSRARRDGYGAADGHFSGGTHMRRARPPRRGVRALRGQDRRLGLGRVRRTGMTRSGLIV
jgi:predicted enzyme related to lactoylglutathione lyase